MKICKDCLKQFDSDGFHPKSRRRCIGCYKIVKSSWDKKFREANKALIKQRKALYYKENREAISEKASERYFSNPEPTRQRTSKWKDKNRGKHNANCMRRYADKLQRTPPWSRDDEMNQFFIEEIYDLAKTRSEMTGVVHHVDHIIPLRGRRVSGLHIWYNLQILTASENCSKSNRLWA